MVSLSWISTLHRYLVGQDSGFPAVNFDSRSVGAGQHVNVQGDHKKYGVISNNSRTSLTTTLVLSDKLVLLLLCY